MFLRSGSFELDHHHILPDHRLSSDHAPLTIDIPIEEEVAHSTKLSIIPGSDKEKDFIKDITSNMRTLITSNIDSVDTLISVVNQLGSIVEHMWTKNSKRTKITKHLKQWWSESCRSAINKYRDSRSREDWKSFKKIIKETKRSFFNNKICEIANSRRGPWDLMNWIKKRRLPATEAIKYNGQPCLSLENLWEALHQTFNSALHRQTDDNVLNEIENKPTQSWSPFSSHEFKSALIKCSDTSAPGPNKMSWRHWKLILSNDDCLSKVVDIADACINLGHWPDYFKISTTIVIPKPNKLSYDNPKAFRPIVLLNTLGKLIEKVIAERIQFTVAANDFIHPSQLGGLKFKSTADAGITLTHIVRHGWVKRKSTSTLAFDISQFFPSLNHHLLVRILDKAGLNPKVSNFFVNYLVRRSTKYSWNDFLSPSFMVDIGVGQGYALSPILSALYLSPLIYILEKRIKNLNLPISILSFIDDGLFIAQNSSFSTSNAQLFCSYNILSNLLNSFGLIVEHSKTEIFHFSRSHGPFNPPPLDLSSIGGPILRPKESWRYLGFIFDRKLTFHKHIDFYANKAISTVKCMNLLGNSNRGINPLQKRLLYRCCALPIALYGFQLWYFNKAPTSYHMKILNKMQRRAAIWILGAFKTSPLEGIEALAGLIPIRFHLQKISKRSLICPMKLPTNHILNNLLDDAPPSVKSSNPHNIGTLTNRQKSLFKGHLNDAHSKLLGIFPSFSPIDPEFSSGSRIVDSFSDRFSFNLTNKKVENSNKKRSQELDEMVLNLSSNSHSALVVTDASIKNDIATSISHIHSYNRPLVKTVHHASFVTTTEVELFAIRCGINQACSIPNMLWSQILSMRQGKYSTTNHICTKSTLPPFSVNYASSSHLMSPILSNFGNVPANLDGIFIHPSIRTPNHSQYRLPIRPNNLGIIARKLIATILSIFGK